MRNPANWQVYAQGSQPTMIYGGRGYTGHEHLNQFGLINMNARLYDPLLARFLAPDPFVASGLTNDFNRYIYARNNPMMYTDPSGQSWKSFWSDVWSSFKRDFKRTFLSADGFEIGYNSNGGGFVNATRGGQVYGPSIGYNNHQVTMGNVQNGIHNMSPISYSSTLEQSVSHAEQIARDEYYNLKSMASDYQNKISNYTSSLLNVVPDVITIGTSLDAVGGIGGGVRPVNLTILTRGDDAGVYFTSGVSGHYGASRYSASATISLTVSYYLGDSNKLKSDWLYGHYGGGSFGAGNLLYGSVGGGFSPVTSRSGINGLLSFGAQAGIGYGGGFSIDYQYTTTVVPIFKFSSLYPF